VKRAASKPASRTSPAPTDANRVRAARRTPEERSVRPPGTPREARRLWVINNVDARRGTGTSRRAKSGSRSSSENSGPPRASASRWSGGDTERIRVDRVPSKPPPSARRRRMDAALATQVAPGFGIEVVLDSEGHAKRNEDDECVATREMGGREDGRGSVWLLRRKPKATQGDLAKSVTRVGSTTAIALRDSSRCGRSRRESHSRRASR